MKTCPSLPSELLVVPAHAGETWWLAGDRQAMKLTAENTRGALSLWFESVPPGGGPPPHRHQREDETFIVLEGEITFLSGDREWLAGPGTVVFAPRGGPHTFQNRGPVAARMIGLVTPGGFDGYFRETAFHGGTDQQRPPITPAEIDRLLESGPRYGLEFLLPAAPKV